MENTLNTVSATTAPIVELKLFPKKDGTWGWRWHNTNVKRDFGPTFNRMTEAYSWLEDTNYDGTANGEGVLFTEPEDSEDEDVSELEYERDDETLSTTETFADVEFEDHTDDSVGNK